MADYTAQDVKKLRDATGAGMMACKKALEDAGGDLDAAATLVRERTGAKMDARAGERTANDGLITASVAADGQSGALLQLHCETDFVAKTEGFRDFARDLAEHIRENNPADVDAMLASAHGEGTVAETISATQAKVGEKIEVAKFDRYEVEGNGLVFRYLHKPNPDLPARVGVMIELATDNADAASKPEFEALANDLSLHIAAMKPIAIDETGVDGELLEKEREFARKEAEEGNKPADVIEKIVEGRARKFLEEVALVAQPYVRDDKVTVAKHIESVAGTVGGEITVKNFSRLEVGA